MSAVLLYVRLALALVVVLAPGCVIARAVGVRGVAANSPRGLVAIFVSLGVTFAVSGTLTLTLIVLLELAQRRFRWRGGGVMPAASPRGRRPLRLAASCWEFSWHMRSARPSDATRAPPR